MFLPLIAASRSQLLDGGEVLEEPNQKKDKPRRKPLPATYEPGAWYPRCSVQVGACAQ